MEAVTIAQTPGELYNSILIDTPLSEFFSGFSEADLDEMNIEIIRNTLFKVITTSPINPINTLFISTTLKPFTTYARKLEAKQRRQCVPC